MEERENIFLREGGLKLAFAVACGVGLNMVSSWIMGQIGLPFYLDTTGTIIVAALGGFFPGIVTSVLTNVLNGYSDNLSIYYTILNALIALVAASAFKSGRARNPIAYLQMILVFSIIGGVGGSLITWGLSGPADSGWNVVILKWVETHLVGSTFPAHVISCFALDLVDKAISMALALLILRLIPQSTRDEIDRFGWQQKPLSFEARQALKNKGATGSRSMRTRVTFILVLAILVIAIAVTWVSTKTFSEYLENERIKTAEGAVNLVVGELDPNKIDEYIEEGDSSEEYRAIEDRLYRIRSSSVDVDYIYVYRIEKDGCRVVFDLDTEGLKGDEPGDLIEFDEAFKPYLPALFAGRPIDPIISNDKYGWLLTLYKPVYNSEGKCVCYAAADISVPELKGYELSFLLKILLVFSGFFVLILAFALWLVLYYIILPVNSMAECAGEFAYSTDHGDTPEESMQRIRELDISTGDEIENLYRAFCKMTEDSVKHMEDIEEQAKTINEMQKGLIITMADMVEGRDSDTGDHVRKTAAYADIILRGLKRKGYYADELTDKFMSDVVQSAPLHDIGKINVSDTILNKPGKLTDEEFDKMKLHTTAGREILDKTISTLHGESYLMEGRNLAAYHHEKWNGRGYPTGLAGEEIPLSARIMAVADVFDALASRRVYKDAMPFEKAVSIIREDAGSHFDPKVVEAFLDSLDEVKEVLDYYNSRELQPKEEE